MIKRMFPMGMFFLIAFSGWTQSFDNGVRKGMVKVKLSPMASSSLGKIQVNARTKSLTTGIASLDAVARTTSATNMYRLFPYDAKHEAKLRKHGLHLWYVVEIDQNTDPKSAVAKFKQLEEVTVAEVEHEKVLAPYTVNEYTPGAAANNTLPFNDPFLKDQWHYNNTGQSGFSDADINLFEAWTKTAGASDIVVAVHDQGVDVSHPDLKENIWVNAAEQNGMAGVDDDNNGYIDDINGYNFEKRKGAVDPQFHATHVAGTIAAVNNNGIGVSGVAGGTGHGDGVKIMSLQIFGDAATEKTYVYAANNGAVISQNSWGYTQPDYYDQSVLDAIDYFIAEAGDYPGSPMKGGIVIFAAGNSNYDARWYPGYHPSILTVASIGPEWKKAAYSNFGDWVEVSAPGGDQKYGPNSGILSTYPKNQYAYLQGTSMACPHVSGIAALALANRNHQLTNKELWNKIVTGVVGIEQYNEEYIGKLGSGALDAALAIQNDEGVAPQAISDLAVKGISQEFATLSWTVPADADDKNPVAFQLYYHTEAITKGNLLSAAKADLKNVKPAGETISFEIDGLLGLTTYYFAITSTDRWGNVSLLSNVVSETTNDGPSIAVDENSQSISLEIDAAVSTSASHDITIRNEASGILRWNHFMRHTNTSLSFNAANLHYPMSTNKVTEPNVAMRNAVVAKTALRSKDAAPSAFAAIEKSYAEYATNIIGDTDTNITNSAAARFYVNENDGFNLTQVRMYLKHDPSKGPVIVEVYKGSSPVKKNLIYAQEHNNYSSQEELAFITLNEQLYFESGATFWVAFHVPSGNLYPLGIGYERDPSYSKNCFMSFNLGTTWEPLEDLLSSEFFAWDVTAVSYNPYLGNYLSLEPGSGDVDGHSEMTATLTVDAATLVNGTYQANLVLASNDATRQELRVPVNVTVTGHQPKIKHIDVADYGSVFIGTEKTIDLVLENSGYGNYNDPIFNTSDPAFTIVGDAPWQIPAREEVVVRIKFKPTTAGNINGVLDFTNGDQSYQVMLFGVGAETSKISITPETQVVNNIALGDVVNAQITIENTGAYPLKYFIPGHDTKGVSENWPSAYHGYGYKFRSSYASESNPLPYEFQNISSSGVNVTESVKKGESYAEVEMGFDFPYYGQPMQKLYIAGRGFTTFDNTVNPVNTPSLNNPYNPKGYISVLGGFFDYAAQGNVFYKVESDRVIVQYDNVWDGYTTGESITAQMVLYANGDIRFFYDNMGFSTYNQAYLNILIEDLEQKDGILVNNYDHVTELYSGLALGFDYPGPDIITKVENGSGRLAPGASAIVDIELSTSSLTEGTINRYVNIISNDPANGEKNALVQLEITSGGLAQPVVSTEAIEFNDVFQTAVSFTTFTIKNVGTANLDISSMEFTNDQFTLNGDVPALIKPGLYRKYEVVMPTSSLGAREDWLTINYADGSHDLIHITGNVVEAPGISVDMSALQETLAYGETSSHPLVIENTGLAPLEVTAVGKQWLSFETAAIPSSYGYTYEKNNTGEVYQWVDIRKTGVHMPFVDEEISKESYWRNLTLPFPIEYYGKTYSECKVGENGIISFDADPEVMMFPDNIPSAENEGTFIMPYWSFSGFNTKFYSKEDVGIFYQFYDDKIIITWSYLINNFGGMGDPVSAQIVLYKNGVMKFQYKVEGSDDSTSRLSSIGLQENSNNGLIISNQINVDHGNGLAFVILPAKKYVIEPATTLEGSLVTDATNVYGGTYTETLKIQSNVPGNELLEKQVELTVTGEGIFTALSAVDFGSKMVQFDNDLPVAHVLPLNFSNEGSAAYDITWAQMADANQGLSLQVYMLVDGWFGAEWLWVDIAEAYAPWAWQPPVFTLKPGDQVMARAIFYPAAAGDFSDELVLTTSLGEKRVPIKGTAIEPPVIRTDTAPIKVVMNSTTETATRTIQFDNLEGSSDLTYDISIDFGRVPYSSATNTGVMANAGPKTQKLSKAAASAGPIAQVSSAYNRVLKYTSKDVADAHAGTGGGEPLVVATRYNAGPDGFNLSHVETWFRTEKLESGTAQVEVRAGGSSIANASVVGHGSLGFNGSGDDETGAWYQIALDEPVAIYPNEDFYIVVTLPIGIKRPQGIVNDEPTLSDRYFYEEEGVWYNIQEVPDFETSGWLMYAAEETAGNSAWLSVTSDVTGSVAVGEGSSTNLSINGAYSKRGDQIANVVIKTNDPKHPVVKIPVTLHMNEAPHFVNAPVNVSVAEKETSTIKIGVLDPEDNAIAITAAQLYPGVTHSFTGGVLSITISPDYGDAGEYTYEFIATDEFNASSEISIPVVITHTNRAPIYTGPADPFQNLQRGTFGEYSINDFFKDEDGDEMTFSVISADGSISSVFSSTGKFAIQSLKAGQTQLTFIVKDKFNGTIEKTLPLSVKSNTAPIYIGPVDPFQNLQKGVFNEYALADYFKDEDGDEMSFSVVSADGTISSVFSSTGKFVIQSLKAGHTELTFTVKDELDGIVVKTLPLSVKPNTAPVIIHALTDVNTHTKEAETSINIENVFTDADGDKLTYTVTSADVKIASVRLTGTVVSITPVKVGETVVSVTATDAEGATVVDEIKVIVNTILGDLDNLSPVVFTVSPNPTSGHIQVLMPKLKEGQIRVMNYLGATLQTINVNRDQDTYPVDLSAEAAGVYLIEVTDGQGARTLERIIKN